MIFIFWREYMNMSSKMKLVKLDIELKSKTKCSFTNLEDKRKFYLMVD